MAPTNSYRYKIVRVFPSKKCLLLETRKFTFVKRLIEIAYIKIYIFFRYFVDLTIFASILDRWKIENYILFIDYFS